MKPEDLDTAESPVRKLRELSDLLRGRAIEDLDLETQAAIEPAETQAAHGEGRPWEEVREELKAKYLSE